MGRPGEVLCLGIAVLDVVQRVGGPPPWGLKSVARSANLAAGGPATNAAVTAARLLGGATLITALGTSPIAGLIREDLSRHGVRIIDIAGPGWEPPVSTCLVGPDGERTVVSVGATATRWELTDEARRELGRAAHDAGAQDAAVQGAGAQTAGGQDAGVRYDSAPRGRTVLLLDGQHPVAATQALATRPAGCLALLDAGSVKAHAEAWLADLDVVAGSADYAAGLGMDLEGAVRHALRAGASAAVMTDGPGAVCWAEQGSPVSRTQPPRVRAVDTLGAGDAFHGALAAGLAHGMPLGEAVDLACRVASTRVAHEGARDWMADVAPLTGCGSGAPDTDTDMETDMDTDTDTDTGTDAHADIDASQRSSA